VEDRLIDALCAIADVNGKYIALEAVIATSRAGHRRDRSISATGERSSTQADHGRPDGARCVHVRGIIHDRDLSTGPPDKMGHGTGPAHAQLDERHLRLAARGHRDTGLCESVFFSMQCDTGNDEVYWLETVLPDGTTFAQVSTI